MDMLVIKHVIVAIDKNVKILKLDLQIPHILIRKLLHLPICIL